MSTISNNSPTMNQNQGIYGAHDISFQDPNAAVPNASKSLQLDSMLQNLSLGHSGLASMNNDFQIPNQQEKNFLLKLSGLPSDFTSREAYAIFALAATPLSVDLKKETNLESNKEDTFIIAKFSSFPLVSQYAVIMNSKKAILDSKFDCNTNVSIIDEATDERLSIPKISQLPQSVNVNGSNTEKMNQFPIPQKSRFSFNNSFSNENENHRPSSHTLSQPDLNLPAGISQSDAGKAFLLQGNDEITDSIWGSNSISSLMNGFNNGAQQSTGQLDWGSSADKNSNPILYMPNGMSSNIVPPHSMDSMPQGQMLQQNNSNMLSSAQQQGTFGIGMPPSNNNNLTPLSVNPMPLKGIDMNMTPTKSQQFKVGVISNSSTPVNNEFKEVRSNSASSVTPQKSSIRTSAIKDINSSRVSGSSTPSMGNNNAGIVGISQADLSLLARVPPPANPADQNPPCNTLYVGNLPPDATEQELRQLFANQPGFRRLSFRNKSNNGNGHGPMCFVEFDDVSFATIALAELYGRQLPRPTVSNKGGIRLSFSKNPLGVRGPKSRRSRNNSTNSTNNSTSSFSNNTSSNTEAQSGGNYSYILGYTKN